MRIPIEITKVAQAYGLHRAPSTLQENGGPTTAPVRGAGVAPLVNQGPGQLERLVDIYGEKKLKQMGIIPCATCESRIYQDQSDDPGVSFKTGGHVSPEQSQGAVLAHELEHVGREQQKAMAEDREVISQSVILHQALCPECGKNYTAGGVTRTTTAGKSKKEGYKVAQEMDLSGAHIDYRL